MCNYILCITFGGVRLSSGGVFICKMQRGGDFLNLFECNWVFEDLIHVFRDWPGWQCKKEDAPVKCVQKNNQFRTYMKQFNFNWRSIFKKALTTRLEGKISQTVSTKSIWDIRTKDEEANLYSTLEYSLSFRCSSRSWPPKVRVAFTLSNGPPDKLLWSTFWFGPGEDQRKWIKWTNEWGQRANFSTYLSVCLEQFNSIRTPNWWLIHEDIQPWVDFLRFFGPSFIRSPQ